MKKGVKSLVLITILLLVVIFSNAQLKLPVVNGIGNDIKKVIEDYPNRFINLIGEVVRENSQSTDYYCNIKLNGAEQTFITRYSDKKDICSWEALMTSTENFDKAKQKFTTLFNQLNNLSVHAGGSGSFMLKGTYKTPGEQNKFNSILFDLVPGTASIKKLKVELLMQVYEPMEWKVKILIYDREREDDERGKIEEE